MRGRRRQAAVPDSLGGAGMMCCAYLAMMTLSPSAVGQCDPQSLVPTGLNTIGEYGYDIDTDGVTIVIGARGDDIAGTDSGSAKVFENIKGSWVEVISLSPGDADAMDNFGTAVAVDGDWLAVGAPFDDDEGNAAGAVYMYERVGGVWTFGVKLTPTQLVMGDKFGTAVALDGQRLAVGAPDDSDMGSDSGAVYMFEHTGSAWTWQRKIVVNDGSSNDEFGAAVDVSGDRVLIGSPFDDDVGVDSGSAYLFELTTARSWSQVAKLITLSGNANDEFGADVSIDGDLAVIGSRKHNHVGSESGVVYIFEPVARAWSETDMLSPETAASGDRFGNAVCVFGERLLVGARLDDDQGMSSGAAFLYKRSNGNWQLQTLLISDDVDTGEFFGWAVALHQDVAVVSALAGRIDEALTGVAYSFDVSTACFCSSDLTDSAGQMPDGAVDVFDLLELLANWGSNGAGAVIAPPTDVVDVFDLLDLLAAWGGCP